MEFKHKSVLLEECIENLVKKQDGIYVDGTLGGAGHSIEILKKLNNKGKLIGIDRDIEALTFAKKKLKDYSNFTLIHDNYSNILNILEKIDIKKVDGILLDLGVSSYQLDEASRGFSYKNDAPLDMRMNQDDKITARDIVNKYDENKLANIIFEYGEEKYSRKIAKKICEYRKEKEIETTLQLVDIIKKAMPSFALKEKQHPAKRTFQAIRIEVNNELSVLRQTVIDGIKALNQGGRLLVITFHSLEDKIIKSAFVEMEGRCSCPKGFPVCICGYKSEGKILTSKPIVSNEEELEENPRARSAKLRIFEKN